MGKRVEGWYGEQFPNQSISQCLVRLYCGRGVVGGFLRKTPVHPQGFQSGSPVSNGDQEQFTVNNQRRNMALGVSRLSHMVQAISTPVFQREGRT